MLHDNIMHPTIVITGKQQIVTVGGQLTKTPATWSDLLAVVPNSPSKHIESWTKFNDSIVFFMERRCHTYNQVTNAWSTLPKTYQKRQHAAVVAVTPDHKPEQHEINTATQQGTGLAANPNIPYYGNGIVQCLYSIDRMRDYFLAHQVEDDTMTLCKPLAKVFRALYEGSDQMPIELYVTQLTFAFLTHCTDFHLADLI